MVAAYRASLGGSSASMFPIIGIVLLFGLVFGSFIMSGGNMGVIIEALPHELMCIFGAAIAAFLISNPISVVKGTAGGFSKVFGGSKWKASDYRDLLSLLFLLTKTMKSKGVIALESHIPKIMKDHFAVDFICDTLRMMTMNLEDPHQVESAMEAQLEKHHHDAEAPAVALTGMADGLPALGIVAAVLGVIKTMGSITEPPAVLGAMIGGALVGTFLGVFLAYGLVAPMATRMKAVVDEEASFYQIIQAVLVAHLHGNAAQISVEIGRGNVPSAAQPSFTELEEALSAIPTDV
jgi:chemotaxis protein MotA